MCLYFLLYVVFTSYKFTPPTPIQTTPRGVTAAHCAINIKSRLILCRVARVVSLLHNSVTKCWKFVKIRVCQWLLPHLNCILCIIWHYLLLQKLVAAIVELRSNPWYHQDQHWLNTKMSTTESTMEVVDKLDNHRASNEGQTEVYKDFTIMEKVPKAPPGVFIFRTRLRHYAKQTLNFGKSMWGPQCNIIRDRQVG